MSMVFPKFFYGFYSVRRASTGSFFAAERAGIKPPTSVKIMLKITSEAALAAGKAAEISMPPVK